MHRFITKTVITASAVCLMLSGLAGCTKKSGDVNNNAVVGITQEPGIFDPHTVVAAGDEEIIFNVYEGLYKYDYEGNLNPCLATDVEISADASVYTFTIRDSVKFHDGSDLDAADVVYSLKRAAGLLDTQDGTALVSELDSIKDVAVAADGRVEVTLESPNSELLCYFTTGIIPEGYDNCQKAPVGTGPFKFVSFIPGDRLVTLGLFDYLTDARAPEHRRSDGVAVAGNLSPECRFEASAKSPDLDKAFRYARHADKRILTLC